MIRAHDLRPSILVNLPAEATYRHGNAQEVVRRYRSQTADETRLNYIEGRF